jgi:hypothetical protein
MISLSPFFCLPFSVATRKKRQKNGGQKNLDREMRGLGLLFLSMPGEECQPDAGQNRKEQT